MAFQIIAAAKVIENGGSMDDAIAKMKEVYSHTKLFLAIDKLDNLVAGGRVSKFAGTLSNLLNIKVMLEIKNGEIHIASKGRGIKSIHREWDKILKQMKEGPKVLAIGISDVQADQEVKRLYDRLHELFPDVKIVVRETVPIIATHTGIGANSLHYYTE